jgi:1-deoxy-D-xylulose-5-phosphate reductoisomerase
VKRLAILGSTGSVGAQALEVVRRFPDRLRVVGLASGRGGETFETQVAEFNPRHVASGADGAGALVQIAVQPDVDIVVVAVPGIVGLSPTLAALEAGKVVATANKETLVAAGHLVMAALARSPDAALHPVDSEHSAIWQCLRGEIAAAVRRIIITSSGGALRDRPLATLGSASVAEVLAHPTWPAMGRKITVDSATLMNKALEVIEAHHLFALPYEAIEVVIHPQSAVHGLVEFVDGSVKAQVGPADMRIPLQVALLFPERPPAPWCGLDLTAWTFQPVDPDRYPALELGYRAGCQGGAAPAVLNAANEAAVEAFLAERIAFGDIVPVVAEALAKHPQADTATLDGIRKADEWARAFVGGAISATSA